MKRLLIIPFLLWATTAYCNPSNQLSLTNVVSGTVISSATQNNNNNTTVSTYNSHTHTDISQLATVTVGVWNATPVQIQFGGTGQTTAIAGFNALSPMSAQGDMIYYNTTLGSTTSATNVAIGSTGTFLASNGTTPSWVGINLANAVGAGTAATLGCVTGILPVSNGGTGTATGALPTSGSYTGDGSSNRPINHGLGRTPQIIVISDTTNQNISTYVNGSGQFTRLSGAPDATTVSSTTFTVTGGINLTGHSCFWYAD